MARDAGDASELCPATTARRSCPWRAAGSTCAPSLRPLAGSFQAAAAVADTSVCGVGSAAEADIAVP